jgi:hypothetical protein
VAAQFDKQRFEALVLYIAHRRKDDAQFGRTKLAKALFYSDFDVYRDTAKRSPARPTCECRSGRFPVS